MATALMTKAAQRAEERAHYIETCEIIEIDEDRAGPYALVPSEDNTATYKVHFAEPRDRASYATDCECEDRHYRKSNCKHMQVVSRYHAHIHEQVRRRDVPYVAPVPMVAKPAKVRRSAPRVEVVKALQVAPGIRVRKARGGGLVVRVPDSAHKMSAKCPVVVPRVGKAA